MKNFTEDQMFIALAVLVLLWIGWDYYNTTTAINDAKQETMELMRDILSPQP